MECDLRSCMLYLKWAPLHHTGRFYLLMRQDSKLHWKLTTIWAGMYV